MQFTVTVKLLSLVEMGYNARRVPYDEKAERLNNLLIESLEDDINNSEASDQYPDDQFFRIDSIFLTGYANSGGENLVKIKCTGHLEPTSQVFPEMASDTG